ncbi:alpha/beta hydrolase [Streptomyces sp. PSAA01]|uniref:alpha/beta hydrolase n=1 Tax=Streptomyces sp. PSAA01 TaxID=2912762 RepID=UPI001F1F51CC|nr:alpha/beta fold hydrolase [Streptomyces sp. PSAA01]MCG0287790.1 alpha/beta hydrolase [Streptomyces sp. PSAA01]
MTRELRATLLTDDAVSIEALYESSPAPGTEPSDHLVLVVGHGFTGALERPALRRVASAFAQRTAVITFSFRGHGRSGGRSTVGDREVLDLAAAVRWARRLGHRRVATVGFSMGGSVVIRQAALYGKNDEIQPVHVAHDGERTGRSPGRTDPAAGATDGEAPGKPGEPGEAADGAAPDAAGSAAPVAAGSAAPVAAVDSAAPDAVIAVSAPARWYYRGTAPMRRVHWAVTRPAGRLVSRYGLRTRIDPRGWDVDPLSPVAAAPLIAPTPLLIVHGDRDPYFPLDHPRMLASAADPSTSELWIEPGFGHAETAASPALLTRIADWAAAHA